jgi:hypothetical protein
MAAVRSLQDCFAMRKPGRALWIAFAVLLSFAAFDDITTDTATDFTVEYAVLAACGVGLLVTSLQLLRGGHRVLGRVSVVALAGAAWGQRGIGPGIRPGFWPEYLVMVAALLWFAALAVFLFVSDSARSGASDHAG